MTGKSEKDRYKNLLDLESRACPKAEKETSRLFQQADRSTDPTTALRSATTTAAAATVATTTLLLLPTTYFATADQARNSPHPTPYEGTELILQTCGDSRLTRAGGPAAPPII